MCISCAWMSQTNRSTAAAEIGLELIPSLKLEHDLPRQLVYAEVVELCGSNNAKVDHSLDDHNDNDGLGNSTGINFALVGCWSFQDGAIRLPRPRAIQGRSKPIDQQVAGTTTIGDSSVAHSPGPPQPQPVVVRDTSVVVETTLGPDLLESKSADVNVNIDELPDFAHNNQSQPPSVDRSLRLSVNTPSLGGRECGVSRDRTTPSLPRHALHSTPELVVYLVVGEAWCNVFLVSSKMSCNKSSGASLAAQSAWYHRPKSLSDIHFGWASYYTPSPSTRRSKTFNCHPTSISRSC